MSPQLDLYVCTFLRILGGNRVSGGGAIAGVFDLFLFLFILRFF